MRYLILIALLTAPSLSSACSCGIINIKEVITESKHVFVAGVKSVKIGKPN
jgi:hypothetical protein